MSNVRDNFLSDPAKARQYLLSVTSAFDFVLTRDAQAPANVGIAALRSLADDSAALCDVRVRRCAWRLVYWMERLARQELSEASRQVTMLRKFIRDPNADDVRAYIERKELASGAQIPRIRADSAGPRVLAALRDLRR